MKSHVFNTLEFIPYLFLYILRGFADKEDKYYNPPSIMDAFSNSYFYSKLH